MNDFKAQRDRMVETQIARRGVHDPAVLEAMRTVPRERFVPEWRRDDAYADEPLPIEEGQTISQPYIVAVMIEAARPQPGDRALEIGTGSGYSAAVLSTVVAEVYTVERLAELAESARRRLAELGYANSTCATPMEPSAGPTMRRMTSSSSPPAARECPSPCSTSSRWAVAW